MSRHPDEAYKVNEILGNYIVIHDAVFKFSWRKAIPIPGFFKPIDYGKHVADLDSLISALDEVADNLGAKSDVPKVLTQYVHALGDAIESLRGICQRLNDKSQGGPRGYPMDQYKLDVAAYEELVSRYLSLGLELNQYLK